jgi:hypothetical protein
MIFRDFREANVSIIFVDSISVYGYVFVFSLSQTAVVLREFLVHRWQLFFSKQ